MALFDALCGLVVCLLGLAGRILRGLASLLRRLFGFGFGFAFFAIIFGVVLFRGLGGGLLDGFFVLGAFDLFAVFALGGPVFAGSVLDGPNLG